MDNKKKIETPLHYLNAILRDPAVVSGETGKLSGQVQVIAEILINILEEQEQTANEDDSENRNGGC